MREKDCQSSKLTERTIDRGEGGEICRLSEKHIKRKINREEDCERGILSEKYNEEREINREEVCER